jgi:lipopolysaccharide/colanic/teichoic acid biosynthesis glycosyltransferase
MPHDDVPEPPGGVYAAVLKRLSDFFFAGLLLVALAPVMVATAVILRVVLGRPVLFLSERAGREGRAFRLVKFRSMSEARDGDGRLLPDAARLGRLGRLLRRTSLDELPQLFNVLVGHMSLIGPRPLPMRYTSRYTPRQAARLLVRPGLSGWAQIHGRNALGWDDRLELDAQYVEFLGRWYAPAVDLWIAVVTAFQIVYQSLTGRGVAAPGSATMTEFNP